MHHKITNNKIISAFSLVEVAIVLAIIGAAVALGAGILQGVFERDRVIQSRERLATIQEALVLFAGRNGRLPCPANGDDASNAATAGRAQPAGANANCTFNANGVVPYVDLGLAPEAVRDAWGRRISYRVFDGANGVTRVNGISMTGCTAGAASLVTGSVPTATLCNDATPPRRVDFLRAKGFRICALGDACGAALPPASASIADPRDPATPPNPPNNINPTGAAYVLISHGETGGGAWTEAGTQRAQPAGGPHPLENANLTAAGPFRSAPANDNLASAEFFDDVILWQTIDSVANAAKIGP